MIASRRARTGSSGWPSTSPATRATRRRNCAARPTRRSGCTWPSVWIRPGRSSTTSSSTWSIGATWTQAGPIDVSHPQAAHGGRPIRFADYGYAGLFDTDKVDEPVLDQLYEFDKQLMTGGRRSRDLADALSADSPSLKSDVGSARRQDRSSRRAVRRAGTSHHRSREVIDGPYEPHRVRRRD